MAEPKTPVRRNQCVPQTPVVIPPSPFLKRLGYGTGVAVYKLNRSPRANVLRSPWALKKINRRNADPQHYSKRLVQEAEILRKLDHPHIVGFRAFIKTADNQYCLAMEECNNSLGDLIETRNDQGLLAFPANNIMVVARDIAEAMNYLHTQALILHGDIKSFNVLVKGEFDVCKLCDFGVSLPLLANGQVCDDAEYVGTCLWSPPEVFKGITVTTKADVFAYGLVLWEMLSLCAPNVDILGESACSTSMLENGYSEEFGKRPDLPDEEFDDSYRYVLEIFHCCTEEEPRLRPLALDLTISIPQMMKELSENGL